MNEGSHDLTPAAAAFAEYLALHETGRAPPFEAFCAARAELAPKLRRLFARWRELDNALGGAASLAAMDPGITLDDADAVPLPDRDRSSRYVDRAAIARGGMGEIRKVWDRDLRRSLAMKVLLGDGTDAATATPHSDPRALSRFLEEAQITAQLDHPGIVPVHELGLDDTGRVYFTMALIRGRSLKEIFALAATGAEGWTRTRVLNVLLRVCEAVAYAHQRGVIHRDLKPANVMVGRFGETYVMDWGLARVLGRDDRRDIRLRSEHGASLSSIATARSDAVADSDSPLVTMDGDVVGTPAYMPPEQARGEVERVGPQADVYAIGAMLYHLLSGQMPYVPPDARITSRTVLARVLDGPPPPLATIATDVPAELAAICGKAMAREPAQRYADVVELAEDLRAFLEQRVVRAYETGAVAELRKWVGRNRALAASAAAAVLALALGLVFSLLQKSRADASAERAEANFKLAFTAVDKMLTRVGDRTLEDVPQMETVRRDLLQEALALLETLDARGNDASLRRDVAEAHGRVGRIQSLLGDHAKAIEAHGKRAAMLEAMIPGSADAVELSWLLVSARQAVGRALAASGQTAAAIDSLRSAVALGDELAQQRAPTADQSDTHAVAVVTLGSVLSMSDRLEEGLALERRAVDLRRALADSQPDDPACLERLAEAQTILAGTLARQRQLAAAAEVFAQADASFARLLAKNPDSANALYLAGRTAINHGAWVLVPQGRRREAIERYRQVVDHGRRLIADYPNIARYHRMLGSGLSNTAQLLRELGQPTAALPLFEEAVAASRRVLELSPDDATAKTYLNNQLRKLGETLVEVQRYEQVLVIADEIAALPFGGFYPRQQAAYLVAACVPWALARGERDEAERHATRALELLRQALEQGLDHPDAVANPLFDAIRERPEFVAMRAELVRRQQAGAGR